MSYQSQCNGLQNYIKTLEKIAEECGEKPKKDAAEKDEFLRHKKRCYELLEEVRDSIRDRQALMKKRGNCYDTIQRGHTLRRQLDDLKKTLPKLQELHKKAQNRWTNKLSKEELQERYQHIRLLKKQVDEANDLFVSGNAGVDLEEGMSGGPSVSLLGLRHAAAEEDCKRNLSADEQGAIDKIRDRDKQLDSHVDELGQMVDRLNPLAQQIGVVADRQRFKAEAIGTDVEKADDDLKALSKKVLEVTKYEKNTNCCCQMVLAIMLLCCVGFIFQQTQ